MPNVHMLFWLVFLLLFCCCCVTSIALVLIPLTNCREGTDSMRLEGAILADRRAKMRSAPSVV